MGGTRVKTGCLTCRIRKVKCDEAKPSCLRCRSTGRTCDGYGHRDPAKSSRTTNSSSESPRGIPLPVQRLPSGDIVIRPQIPTAERGWINYFEGYSISFTSDAYDNHVWRRLIPQLCHDEPAIRHAVMAVAASHSRLQITPNGSTWIPHLPSAPFELEHYNKAIQRLGTLMMQQSTKQVNEVALTCCLLFVCLECIYGNKGRVNLHLKQGKQILQATDLSPEFGTVKQTLQQLITQSALFGNKLNEPGDLIVSMEEFMMKTRPSSFAGISDAREALEPLMHLTISLVQTLRLYHRMGKDVELEAPLEGYTIAMHAEMLVWQREFDVLQSKFDARQTRGSRHDLQQVELWVLLLKYTATYIWLQTCLDVGESVYDRCLGEFQNLVSWSRAVLDNKRPAIAATSRGRVDANTSFELEQSVSPALYLTAIKCRHSKTRRGAIGLMKRAQHRQWLWNSIIHARVAMRIVELEEAQPCHLDQPVEGPGSLVFDQAASMSVPETMRIRNVHIGVVDEGDSRGMINVRFRDTLGHEWIETLEVRGTETD